HLESIKAADFLWSVCSHGHAGQSASMEIDYAAAMGVPILPTQAPSDLTLRQYVKTVPSLATAVRMIAASPQRRRPEGILIDPHASVEKAHYILERIGAALTRPNGFEEPTRRVYRDIATLQKNLSLPTYT